jgi:hypothetical protein
MIDIASLPSVAQAGALIGAVLVEAVVLYVGYGALTTAIGPSVKRALAGER